ncbi:MAG: hypothetical protein GY815_05695, partial [Gammaproteobacteria bacterium]|nr:hypothetical protein [Gammaproteobacteria bacterium]
MNEAEKEQALKLSALFKELAEKGTWFEVYQKDIVGVWQKTDISPTLNSTLPEWIVADKPVEPKKIIVLPNRINTTHTTLPRP